MGNTLPLDSKERKSYPLFEGLLKYFPKALAEVAHVSKIGNDKHNPGESLHHARGKSHDHADCIIRHLIDMSEDMGKGRGMDENGVAQVAYIAWRALALAQEWYEVNEKTVVAPNAKEPKKEGVCSSCGETSGRHLQLCPLREYYSLWKEESQQ